MKAVVEGLLFVVGDEGISIKQISDILEISEEEVSNLIKELENDYESDERGITLKRYGSLYKLATKEIHSSYYKKLSEISDAKTLSQSALETLAIIAYNEPVTRLQVDELRGINSSQMIRNLIAKDLVKVVGKSDGLGHPTLYGITNQFLDYFGISSKDELPNVSFEEKDNEDIDLYESKYREE